MAGEGKEPPGFGVTAIGRYFIVVSLIPSTVFAAYLLLLLRTGTWSAAGVDLDRAFRNLDLRALASLSVLSIALAIAIHPLQFALIQALEGYWGVSGLGRRLASAGIMRHRRRARALLTRQLDDAMPDDTVGAYDAAIDEPPARSPMAAPDVVARLWSSREAARVGAAYPHRFEDVMPTRFGNVLRRYETIAGHMYGLESITAVTRVMQVAAPRDVEYVQNQRMQMELAARTCVLGLLAAAVTAVLMWTEGWYLLLTLVPYLVAFAAYRGAVVLAHEYGTALAVLIELNRFALYERLRLPRPSSLAAERRSATQLIEILRLDSGGVVNRYDRAQLRYAHPQPARSDSTTPGATATTTPSDPS
ncbi:hypothetical protein [Micromonospora coerulea]|uniref:hypothetical protein n=1 Tax=Micromonospora coerulea TaxID=47856 RepID=UPI001908A48F|nr:hypothetical protein [Micromonospora veneta]